MQRSVQNSRADTRGCDINLLYVAHIDERKKNYELSMWMINFFKQKYIYKNFLTSCTYRYLLHGHQELKSGIYAKHNQT